MLKEESASLTTRQNALFSVPIAAAMGAKEIVVLSDRKHILRWYLNLHEQITAAVEQYR